MAKLRISAPDGKTLLVDVGDSDPSTYDDQAAAALEDYTSKQTLPHQYNEMEGAADVGRLLLKAGDYVKAGGAGIANLVSGNGLQQAASDTEKVKAGEKADTKAGKVGSFVGGLATPVQIALQGAIPAVVAESGLGEWAATAFKGWAEDVATAAVGKIKALAKVLGLDDLNALGRFLLSPIKVGKQEFPAIIQAGDSPATMLANADTALKAAGRQLEQVSQEMDTAIKSSMSGNLTAGGQPRIVDFMGVKAKVEALKEAAVGDIPNLGRNVARQFDRAIRDLENFFAEQEHGLTETAFSDLSAIKTKIGNLAFKYGNQTENIKALQEIYGAVSDSLREAAESVKGPTSELYLEANDVYHKLMTVVNGLEGRAIDAKQWFGSAGMTAAMTAMTGAITHSPVAALSVPAAAIGTKIAQTYGPQAIARGLDAASRLISPALKITANGVPFLGNAIAQGLSD